jgi:hypothetical protein
MLLSVSKSSQSQLSSQHFGQPILTSSRRAQDCIKSFAKVTEVLKQLSGETKSFGDLGDTSTTTLGNLFDLQLAFLGDLKLQIKKVEEEHLFYALDTTEALPRLSIPLWEKQPISVIGQSYSTTLQDSSCQEFCSHEVSLSSMARSPTRKLLWQPGQNA